MYVCMCVYNTILGKFTEKLRTVQHIRRELMHLILHPQMNYTPHIQYLNHVPTNSIIPTNVMAPIIITRFIAVAFGHKYISYRLHQNFHYLLTRTFKHNTLLLIRIRHWTMDV